MTDDLPALRLYAANSATLAERYETVEPAQLFAPVLDLLPPPPARLADIGAGSGRDAAWFAGQGYPVTAVEPVAELRAEAQRRHPAARIDWVMDHLPLLPGLRGGATRFDLVTAIAVWHHLNPDQQGQAMASLSDLLLPGGLLILSLRHGPINPDAGLYAADPEAAMALAAGQGLTLMRRAKAGSVQARDHGAGIEWTWLALSREVRGHRTDQGR